MEKTPVMLNSPIVRELRANSKFEFFNREDSSPYDNDPDVRKAQGKLGLNYIREFPKHGHLLYWDPETRKMHGAVYFSIYAEGPPGCAHGGSIAASFDHLMGNYVFRAFGVNHYTVNLSVDYKLFIPLDTTVRVLVETEKQEGRKVFLRATMTSEAGKVHAVSTALFLRKGNFVPYEKVVEISQGRTKEETVQAFLKSRM